MEPVVKPGRCWGPERSTNYPDKPRQFLLHNFVVKEGTCYQIVGSQPRPATGVDVRGIYLDCTYVCRVLTVFLTSI